MDYSILHVYKHEPVFYNAVSFEHQGYDMSSPVQDKEYMEKVDNAATGGFN